MLAQTPLGNEAGCVHYQAGFQTGDKFFRFFLALKLQGYRPAKGINPARR